MADSLTAEIVLRLVADIESWDTEQAVLRTLRRLPQPAREAALDICWFIDPGGYAQALGPDVTTSRIGRALVVLADDLPAAHIESIIAHEIAHVLLGHSMATDHDLREQEAADQTRAWGFTGCGTRPSSTIPKHESTGMGGQSP